MNCIRAVFDTCGLRGIVALALAIAAMVFPLWLPVAQAGADEPGPMAVQAQMTEQQQKANELEGESELPWLFAVFAITWAAFFAYVFLISRRQREMQNDIQALRTMLADREQHRLQAEAEPESK